MRVINLGEIRAERRAASVATAVLADLAVIRDRLIGFFHVDAGSPATDIELGAAGLLCLMAERLEQAAHILQHSEEGDVIAILAALVRLGRRPPMSETPAKKYSRTNRHTTEARGAVGTPRGVLDANPFKGGSPISVARSRANLWL